jgi:hypothetical protein
MNMDRNGEFSTRWHRNASVSVDTVLNVTE